MRTHPPRTWRMTLVCFCISKRVYLLPTGKVPSLRAALSEAFSGMSEGEGPTRTQHRATPDQSPQGWGSKSRSTREGTYPRDNCMKKMWRGCYLFGTKPFSGDRNTCYISLYWSAGINPTILTGPWVTGGKAWLLDFLPLGASHTLPAVARVGVRSVRPCWLPLAGQAGTLGLFCTYSVQL